MTLSLPFRAGCPAACVCEQDSAHIDLMTDDFDCYSRLEKQLQHPSAGTVPVEAVQLAVAVADHVSPAALEAAAVRVRALHALQLIQLKCA